MKNNTFQEQFSSWSGLFALSLRLVIGWTYFSAFWRRVVLEDKLSPEVAGYVGEKFNHFLPNALGIKPLIEYLVSNPEKLEFAMISFTIVEAIVGLFIMLGLFTRLMSIGVFSLAMGILLGSGWLGTTCLDEWQIGVLGLAGGFTIFLTGGGFYSLDDFFMQKKYAFTSKRWFNYLGSGVLAIRQLKPLVLVFSLFIFAITLFTNQYFHGGVFGKLHNKSVKPKVEISNVVLADNELTFEVFRVEGADVYGSFLIEIQVLDDGRQVIKNWDMNYLSKFPKDKINNHYVAKVKPGKHSLILPLGAKADLSISLGELPKSEVKTLKLIDISGAEWTAEIH
ncbi:quinol oxidase [Capnocytophaga felis]|uniref:TQO small subunit DoxD n=1 Tax=Capnocytophaga felis TaxID=2267611 RepID=UPI0012CB179E|nr:TQO small subunit DoxD [Capnocytophaga felis]GET49323.1 quinol oxidase [Capnocytophaga felis]